MNKTHPPTPTTHTSLTYDPTLLDKAPPTWNIATPLEQLSGHVITLSPASKLATLNMGLLLRDAGGDDRREVAGTIRPPDLSDDPAVRVTLSNMWKVWNDPELTLDLLENINALDELFTSSDLRIMLVSSLWYADRQDQSGTGWGLLWKHWDMGSQTVTLSFWTTVCRFSHVADFILTTGVTLSLFATHGIPTHVPIPCYGFASVAKWWTRYQFTDQSPFRLWLAQFAPYPMTADALDCGALDWKDIHPSGRKWWRRLPQAPDGWECRVGFTCGCVVQTIQAVHSMMWRSYDRRDGAPLGCCELELVSPIRYIHTAEVTEGPVTRFLAGILKHPHTDIPAGLTGHWQALKAELFRVTLTGWNPRSQVHGSQRLDLLRSIVNDTDGAGAGAWLVSYALKG